MEELRELKEILKAVDKKGVIIIVEIQGNPNDLPRRPEQ
jgi:uncharacterized membrane-anchored protein YitT (DUF2179 family)